MSTCRERQPDRKEGNCGICTARQKGRGGKGGALKKKCTQQNKPLRTARAHIGAGGGESAHRRAVGVGVAQQSAVGVQSRQLRAQLGATGQVQRARYQGDGRSLFVVVVLKLADC